jgi:hypothetical protein
LESSDTSSHAPEGQPELSSHTLSLEARLNQLQRYLPAHLSEKILANRGRLEGERKLVTVLFADLIGYNGRSTLAGPHAARLCHYAFGPQPSQ